MVRRMDYVARINAGEVRAREREEACHARSRYARGWIRVLSWALFAVFLTAAWQNRALAPPVHEGMKRVVAQAVMLLDNSENARAFVEQSLSGPAGSSIKPEFDPITAWLLKWRK